MQLVAEVAQSVERQLCDSLLDQDRVQPHRSDVVGAAKVVDEVSLGSV